ncbi:MAG: tetratricopeptide repeat protein [Pseudomonadota bacterium]
MLKWFKRPPAPTAEPASAARRAAEARQQGNALLDQGKLEEALQPYREAVALEPSPEAFVSLGYTLGELGRADEAVEALEQAVRMDPAQFDAIYLLGTLALGRGNYPQAISRLSRALELQPSSDMVLRDLCSACFLGGDLARAHQVAQAGAAAHPQQADFHFFLGNILTQQGHAAGAVECFDKALLLQPAHPEGHYNRALALHAAGRLEEAAQGLRTAIAQRPGYVPALTGLASVLTDQGQAREAEQYCRQALALDGRDAEAHNALGNVLLSLGRPDDAAESYRHALALHGGHAQAHANLGLALMAQDRMAPAVESLRKAVALDPRYARGHNNLGIALQRQGHLEDAVAAYGRAIELDPALAQAHSNFAAALQAQGHHELAITSWRKALALEPGFLDAWSNLVYVMSFMPGVSAREYLDEATRFGRAAVARAVPFTQWPSAPPAALAPGEPLRVGFVSGDFREHPVGFFLEGILGHFNPSRVVPIAYPTRPGEDRLTARIKPRFAAWNSLAGMSDEEAARKIHADGVHLLVDLAGHSEHNRLPVFAWRPAPVQLTWLGYFASTGTPGIDYLVADPPGVPPHCREDFSEAVRYMPDTRLCFTAPEYGDELQAGPLPAMSSGHLTFGCFQNMTKLNDDVLALWGKVFRAMPEARLRHQSRQMGDASLREQLFLRLEQHGIARDRADLAGPTGRQAYLAAHQQVDIMLDTFPYTGATTTCEALWMGVPTMTLAGRSLLARQGASLLTCAGLASWVAEDEDEFLDRLLRHCSDLQALAGLRAGLRAQVLASPLFDGARFAGNLESLLHSLWRERVEGAGA